MTFDATSAGDYVLLSYDVSGGARSVATRVCQIVFGRRRTVHGKARNEPGFIHRTGVTWVGQSVFVMPSHDAEDLCARLRGLGVRVAIAPVVVSGTSLEVFRRPRA